MGKLNKAWLNENKFTRNILNSLMQLPHLVELHLEGNQFSGKNPELKYPDVLKSLDLKDKSTSPSTPTVIVIFVTLVIVFFFVMDEKGAFGFEDLIKADAEVLGNSRTEEKLIISEHMPCSSLLFAFLGDRGLIHGRLNWQNRLKIIKGIADRLGYIHAQLATYVVPHANLKSCNVFLTETYDPLLSDYGFHQFVNSDNVVRGLFAYRSPECLQNQQYVSPKSHVYCLGIVILETMTGKYPSHYLNNGDGGIEVVQWAQSSISENYNEKLIDPDMLSSGPASIDQMIKIIKIGVACTKSNSDQRLNLNVVINKIEEVN
ncbi:Leucine-rich repeat protein kinase family protein, putative isoform 2 [Hibiscus syriacus]|uniref:Leucine-rich repeat protein kinase family protein, putative isoform 2 n=1 Tax=Hibiscus syriacus TaxID=106335 RepID=A0A6A2Z7W8_HIBSY|nr:Leucine-rich repeat protein kinase family protein, putative isoform 2 [Hibiscus syriacus]